MIVLGQLSLSSENHESATDEDVAVAPIKAELKPPSKYKVILLNDDFTTMDFVIEILQKFFSMTMEQATQTMLEVHTKGHAVCGIYSRDVAETKAQQVNSHARQYGHPLLCRIGKAD